MPENQSRSSVRHRHSAMKTAGVKTSFVRDSVLCKTRGVIAHYSTSNRRGGNAAAGAEVVGEILRQAGGEEAGTRSLDIVGYTYLLGRDLVAVNGQNAVADAGVAVFGPADTAGVDEMHPVYDPVIGDMLMSNGLT